MHIKDDFQLDERLQASSFKLIDWPLSCVLLKDNSHYPWFILVPRRLHLTELTEFSKPDRCQLMDEMHQLSRIVQCMFKPDKINIGALGNIVAQFHMHVVARYRDDPLWPQGIWQSTLKEKAYVEPGPLIASVIDSLSSIIF
jgi:diadenosine tetraphosphate (Ap4A) HIT family hydrolase